MLSAEQNLQKQLYQLDIKKDKEFEIIIFHKFFGSIRYLRICKIIK